MPNSRGRFVILKIVIAVMLAAVLFRMFNLQIIQGEQYSEVAASRLTSNIVEKAPRGEILDTYGTPLVTNKVGYSVVMQRSTKTDEELNYMIKKLVDILTVNGCDYYDSLPITFEPYGFQFEDNNGDGSINDEMASWFENNKYKNSSSNPITPDMTAQQVMDAYKKIYRVSPEYSEEAQRGIVGIRYEADLRGFSQTSPFTVAENVSVDVVTQIKERQNEFVGVSVINDYVREYAKPGLATHVLGRIGMIDSKKYELWKNDGYGMNDVVGIEGIELWAEKYLRGVDGTAGSLKKVSGREVISMEDIDPIPGNYLVLTLDSELQQVLESSLEKNINQIRAQGGVKEKDGYDCNAGAAVVIEVKTGNVLAMGSYPTFDMTQFNDVDYYAMLNSDTSRPMFNRAVSGQYSPGSTFKPLTAIAAIQSGNLTLDEIIVDKGVYKKYDTYQPSCWIWNEYQMTHGAQDVTLAIENSCNYFFYEVGDRMGIDTLNEYAHKFGLGQLTGVELTEETAGNMANPEYKKQVETNITSRDWYKGDTLQAAIGQSYSLFTPIQLANYAATIANGGTRYKANLIKSIRSSEDGSIVKEFAPQVEEEIDLDEDVLAAIKDGMKKVVDEGSAADIFSGYAIQVGGKTGTAQVGNGSNNAVFIAYAPFNDPQIAVAVVLEHGVRGTNAGYVAKDIFDKYFNLAPQAVNPDGTQAAPPTAAPTAQPQQDNGLLR